MLLRHLQKNLNEGQICIYGRVLQVGLGQYYQDKWAQGLPNRHSLHKEAYRIAQNFGGANFWRMKLENAFGW